MKGIKQLFLCVLLVCAGWSTVFSQQLYSQWRGCIKITINTTPSGAGLAEGVSIAHVPVLIRLNSSTCDVSIFDIINSNGDDLRFTDSTKTVNLPYAIERWDTNARTAEIFVKLTLVEGNRQTYIHMHYGKSDAAPAANSAEVFSTGNSFTGVWNLATITADRTLLDETAHGYHGSVENYPQVTGSDIVDGTIGKALHFTEAEKDAVWLGTNIPDIKSLQNNFTVSAWIHSQDLFGIHWIAASTQYPAVNGFGFGTYGNNLLFSTFGVKDYIPINATISADTWYHVAAVMDANNDVRFYINGECREKVSGSYHAYPGTNGFLLGASTLWTGNYLSNLWDGTLDHIRIYSTAKDSNWIKLCYENQKPDQTLVTIDSDMLWINMGSHMEASKEARFDSQYYRTTIDSDRIRIGSYTDSLLINTIYMGMGLEGPTVMILDTDGVPKTVMDDAGLQTRGTIKADMEISTAIKATVGDNTNAISVEPSNITLKQDSVNKVFMGIGLEGPTVMILGDSAQPVTTMDDAGVRTEGVVEASSFKVGEWVLEEENIPDYVFNDDYPLQPLGEVESFVKKNRHLPNIPDAKTIRKEGVDLVGMNLQLLRKIEEITMYLIQQEKELQEQRKLIMQQQEEIENLQR